MTLRFITRLGLVFFISSLSYLTYGQKYILVNHPIKDISASELPNNEESDIKTSKSRLVTLDLNTLRSNFENYINNITKKSAERLVIELPHPDGSNHTYEVYSNTTMHSDLAAKFPQISTYDIYGVSHPEESGKLDITHKGLHAMINSPVNSTIFIDPFNQNTTENYLVYFKKDFTNQKTLECGTYGDVDYELHKKSALGSFGDCRLRKYRIAIAATGEYTDYHGGTVADGLAAIVTSLNRVSGVYEKTLAITFELIANNDDIIYTDASTDPYTNGDAGAMIGENQSNINSVIGSANYDVGHLYGTGGAGLAALQSVCSNSRKASGVTGIFPPIGDPFSVDYVCHELGHQFGATHTQNNNCNRTSQTAVETGSGVTIMSYAGICPPNVQSNSIDNFHSVSIEQMGAFITGFGSCASTTNMSNTPPEILSTNTENLLIPSETPFILSAEATDNEQNVLLYQWEQIDNETGSIQPPRADNEDGPMFRNFELSESPTRYLPRLEDLRTSLNPGTAWEVPPSIKRELNFRLLVQDNNSIGSCNSHVDVTVDFDETTGPFSIIYPSEIGIEFTQNTTETILWDVAGTDADPINCENVDILLSVDNGLTYIDTIATNVPNLGSYYFNVNSPATDAARIMIMCSNKTFFNVTRRSFSIKSNPVALTELDKPLFRIYPNPAKDKVTIVSDKSLNSKVSILDVTGKEVLKQTVNGKQLDIDIASLNAGIYFVKLHNSTFNTTQKLIIE